jgi:hypothetical protein
MNQITELVRATVLQNVTDTLKFFMFFELRNTSITNNLPPNPSSELSHSNFPNSPLSNTAVIYIFQSLIKILNIGYFYSKIILFFILYPICACSQRLWHWLYICKISLKTLIRLNIDRKYTIKQLLMVGTKRLKDVRNLHETNI